ncbi:acyltransferase family protein [Pigmentiphaga litoralis]|uniref:Peptidoglycan/LPS O-acetylase OafA/YrhL n=1 Tax=Pigmentiphaga litoralis TaxID=516702 RepID=A0A7Y9LMY5_9BURK|nr:acyltransferase [Pigmentiphaga litoralis]NYE24230.1 peptidoglycan/LPS O-acetylase OafA/YrhL [Pigmentiphaga litoralis]NYE82156.1 peptidoglycan/LPS O-acetylase OafA/YrhL [Pigmentiphaga litoralis]
MKTNNFDVLRFTLAFMVMLFHIGMLSEAPELRGLSLISGAFAVNAFFIISGFLICMSCERSSSMFSYALKRLRRVYPAYLVAILFTFVIGVAFTKLSLQEFFAAAETYKYLFYNLIFLNFKQVSLPGVFEDHVDIGMNGSLWTLKIEIMFYALVPFIMLACRKFGAFKVLALGYFLSIAYRLTFLYLFEVHGDEIYSRFGKQLPGQLCFFLSGALFYFWFKAKRDIPAWVALLGIVAYNLPFEYVQIVVGPLGLGAAIVWFALHAMHLGNFGKHGDMSYGIYVYHFPLVQVAVSLGLFASAPYLSTLAICAIVLVLAYLSFRYIENPFLGRKG